MTSRAHPGVPGPYRAGTVLPPRRPHTLENQKYLRRVPSNQAAIQADQETLLK
ncbi:MAG TPA: hypothetical protein VKA46_22395 [Gemmataceae bacterium]|nr:hypothetical protein [Gemmataceae bacterium]